MAEFKEFEKIPRLSRDCVVTEKIDGTNSSICIESGKIVYVGSRSRIITVDDDNFGFARWVSKNSEKLCSFLGDGVHFGEWFGKGIQKRYNVNYRKFALFNVGRWTKDAVLSTGINELDVVPTLYTGMFDTNKIDECLELLRKNGSYMVPGCMRPEGIIIYHTAGGYLFKKTLEKDSLPKSLSE